MFVSSSDAGPFTTNYTLFAMTKAVYHKDTVHVGVTPHLELQSEVVQELNTTVYYSFTSTKLKGNMHKCRVLCANHACQVPSKCVFVC